MSNQSSSPRVRPVVVLVVTVAAIAIAAASARAAGLQTVPSAAASIAGEWRGAVTAEMGQMVIALKMTVVRDKATGDIETGHGVFRVKDGKFAEGVWTLPFESEDGLKGQMKGAVKGDIFSGEWDLRPMALGKFEVTRKKAEKGR